MKTRYFQESLPWGTLRFLSMTLVFVTITLFRVQAQIAEWTFENISSAVPNLPIAPSYKIPQARASANLSGGNNNGSPAVCSGNESWSTNFWPTGSSRSSGDYLEFSVLANPGEPLEISYFSFSSSASSSSSALDFDVYYSKNSFNTSSYLFSGSQSTSSCSFHGGGLNTTLSPNATIRFRIYPYGQNVAAQAATIRIDDVSIEGGLLPVTLTDFSAEEQDGQVLLQWRTAVELNNDYFAVEHSPDGLSFEEIGRVKGMGNSQVLKDYQFLHRQPVAGSNYYRLQQVDLDGARTIHQVIQMDLPEKNEQSLVIWPTSVHQTLHIRLGEQDPNGSLDMWSLNGQFIRQIKLSAKENLQELDVTDLPSGWYALQYRHVKGSYTYRFFKQ